MVTDSKAAACETDLTANIQFAVREIVQSQHLRALLRHFLGSCNLIPTASVFDLNPVQNAYNQGFQAAGLLLSDLLTSVEPRLIPTLTLEELTADE